MIVCVCVFVGVNISGVICKIALSKQALEAVLYLGWMIDTLLMFISLVV